VLDLPGRHIDMLVVGEINPDIVVSDPDPIPRFGEIERVVDSVAMTVGSSSAIFACGAARLGLRVAFYGAVGDDAFGRFMLDAMRGRGIDVSACVTDPTRPTGASVILAGRRDRAILTALGSIGAMDIDALPGSLLARVRHVHSGSYYLQETSRPRLPAFLRAARARGITTSFDTNWDPAERWDPDVSDMLRAADVFLPNAVEARMISGEDDIERAARALAAIGAEGRPDGGPLVVVKLGGEGALACRATGPLVRVPAMPVEPLETTGAGDSFDAGFLHAWMSGRPLEEALRLGAVCGALATQRLGGVDGQPTLERAAAALRRWSAA
jgi:sugar/nucleoside kinase (ribokinase family)